MAVKEIVLVVKDTPGELARIVGHLYENDVQVSAFWVGSAHEKATIRMITSDPETAVSVLTGLGCKPGTKDVISVQVPDHPGGLNTILQLLRSARINILHIYPCLDTRDPTLILEVDNTNKAVKVLQENWINMHDNSVYSL